MVKGSHQHKKRNNNRRHARATKGQETRQKQLGPQRFDIKEALLWELVWSTGSRCSAGKYTTRVLTHISLIRCQILTHQLLLSLAPLGLRQQSNWWVRFPIRFQIKQRNKCCFWFAILISHPLGVANLLGFSKDVLHKCAQLRYTHFPLWIWMTEAPPH